MDKLVVDSSVVVKWFLVEPYSTEARTILDGYQAGRLSFHAPDLLNAELGNILWKKQLFQGLDGADAQDVLDRFATLQVAFTSTESLLRDAHRMAVTLRRTVYDALYLALSAREDCQFVTADEKLVNAVTQSFPKIVWLGTWSETSRSPQE